MQNISCHFMKSRQFKRDFASWPGTPACGFALDPIGGFASRLPI